MGFKTDNNFMIESFNSLFVNDEYLYSPFYGCIIPNGFFKTAHDLEFGFFGRTDSDLLIGIFCPFNGREIKRTIKIPLNILMNGFVWQS